MTLADHLNSAGAAAAELEVPNDRLYLADLTGAELVQVGPYRLTSTKTTDLITPQLVTLATTGERTLDADNPVACYTAHYANGRWHTPA